MIAPYDVYLIVGTGETFQPTYLDDRGRFVPGLANARRFYTREEADTELAKCQRCHNATIQTRRVRD